ncbi:MAG: AbrB/MazE/SpoVT family DNA-binding domain-containing protein [Bryobacteraceae bacterium]|jgi:AbrB family looped-hinge helix DNA binding protein
MPRSTITSKGQITIPKEVRDEMGLKPGDRVNFVKDRKGQILLRPLHSDFRSLRGMVKSRLNRPITLEEMDEAIARGALGE